MMASLIKEFAMRVKDKVQALSGVAPPIIIEGTSDEEIDRLCKEHEERWGPGHDVLVIHWNPENDPEAEPA